MVDIRLGSLLESNLDSERSRGLMESGCHKGRDAEADGSRLIPGTPRAFLELKAKLTREPDVPAPHSWAAGSSEATLP